MGYPHVKEKEAPVYSLVSMSFSQTLADLVSQEQPVKMSELEVQAVEYLFWA